MQQDFFTRILCEGFVAILAGPTAVLEWSSGIVRRVTRNGVGDYTLTLTPPGLYTGSSQSAPALPRPIVFVQASQFAIIGQIAFPTTNSINIQMVDAANHPFEVPFFFQVRIAQRLGGNAP